MTFCSERQVVGGVQKSRLSRNHADGFVAVLQTTCVSQLQRGNLPL